MKKSKILNICLAIFAVVIIVAIFLILYFYDKSDKLEDYREEVYNSFEILIPQKWECLYHNQGSFGGFQGEGTSFRVFKTEAEKEDFFEGFSDSKDFDFEKYVKDLIEWHFNKYDSPIDSQYLCNMEQPYEWFMKTVIKDNGRKRAIAMIYQLQKIYIFTSY